MKDPIYKRLTDRDEYGNADIIGVDSEDLQMNLSFDEFNLVTGALNLLAAYEDTGLTPEEITGMDDFINSQCAKLLAKAALQARAEALERAIFEARDCSFCVHQNIDRLEDVYCDVCLFAEEERPRWQFDEARFSGESTPRQNEMED